MTNKLESQDALWRATMVWAHSTPDPEPQPNPPPPPVPDDEPDPAHAPVEDPRFPEPPIRVR